MKQAMINYVKNPKNDELYTPEYAVYPLLPYLKKFKNKVFGNALILEKVI